MISFFADQPFNDGSELTLDDSAVAHARARRIAPGESARLLDGKGAMGRGTVIAIEKHRLLVRIDEVRRMRRPIALEVIVPIADKDRMLWAAEKCTELQVTVWRPVLYARSRSVSPRGEGPRFREKIEARMRGALEQSGGAWLPEIAAETDFEGAIDAVGSIDTRLLLDSSGTSIGRHISNGGIALAIGPEGGLEPEEVALAADAGWEKVSLGASILRFETAIIAATAAVRAAQTEGTV